MKINYLNKSFNLKPFTINLKLSPTYFEFSKNIAHLKPFYSSHAELEESTYISSNKNQLSFSSFFITKKDLENNLTNLTFESYNFSINKMLSKFNQYSPSLINMENISGFNEFVNASAQEILLSNNHEISISPIKNSLILRAIDNNDAGTPWVEVCIMAEKEKNSGIKLKELMVDLPTLNELIIEQQKLQLLLSKETGLFETKDNLLKINLIKKLINNKTLFHYYTKNKSWYNYKFKGMSDAKGYLIIKSEQLIPGKKYTMYLWSKSKDQLKPDKEITFIAKKGITDLGAIKF